jgi:hypothetical protein
MRIFGQVHITIIVSYGHKHFIFYFLRNADHTDALKEEYTMCILCWGPLAQLIHKWLHRLIQIMK